METVAKAGKLRHVKRVQSSPDAQPDNEAIAGLTNEQLMLRYSRGDAQAFETLYQRNKNALYRYFLRQTSRIALAEEMSHEVWLRVIKARQRYTTTARFTTYLFQIAHNCLVDLYRKQGRQPEMNGDEPELAGVPAGEDCDPATQVTQQQARTAFLKLLGQLPGEQREVFILKEEAQLSIDEIASIIDENPETVKSRLRYATRKLKDGLQEWLNR
jgi:RNA polymerase sigma-70 factor (ECF subfamily)